MDECERQRAGPGASHLVYFHQFGVFLRPLDGHLDDVGRRRHGWGRVVRHAPPDRCLLVVFSPPVCYLIQICGRKKKKEGYRGAKGLTVARTLESGRQVQPKKQNHFCPDKRPRTPPQSGGKNSGCLTFTCPFAGAQRRHFPGCLFPPLWDQWILGFCPQNI